MNVFDSKNYLRSQHVIINFKNAKKQQDNFYY